VAARRCPIGFEKDGIAVLPEDATTVSQRPQQGRARIAVAVIDRTFPEHPRRFARPIDGDEKGAYPTAITIVIAQQRQPVFLTPSESGIAMFRLRQFRRLAAEGRAKRHEPVTMWDLFPRVAFVKCFGPNESRWFRGPPLIAAWPLWDAFN